MKPTFRKNLAGGNPATTLHGLTTEKTWTSIFTVVKASKLESGYSSKEITKSIKIPNIIYLIFIYSHCI